MPPTAPRCSTGWAFSTASAGQYPQAVEAFRQIAPLEAQSAPRAAVQIIETYRAAKDFESARKEADAALKKYPNERMVQLTHASLLADLGKIDEAAAEVRGLMKGQDDRDTQLELAQIYEKGKRWADMAPLLDQAEKLSMSDDDKASVHFMRGAMYERMKKYDAAEAEFRKVLELDADNAGAMNYLGYMLADRDVRLDEAYQLIKKALDLDPQNGAYLDSLGWVYYRQGKLNEAEGLLLQALDHIGQDPTVHDHLGDVYFKLGKTKDAITQWQASLEGVPGRLAVRQRPGGNRQRGQEARKRPSPAGQRDKVDAPQPASCLQNIGSNPRRVFSPLRKITL